MNKLKNIYCLIQVSVFRTWMWVMLILMALPSKVLAESDPFGDLNIDASQLQNTTTSDVTKTLKIALIVAGAFLMVTGVVGLINVIKRTTEEKKEHGGSVVTILVLIFCAIIGLIFVALGWKGASYTAS